MDSYPTDEIGTKDEINFLINHIFLPPRLPESSDIDDSSTKYRMHATLLNLLVRVAKDYKFHSGEVRGAMTPIIKMLSSLSDIKENGVVSLEKLEKKIKAMKPKDVICLHIDAQNAGLIIRHEGDEITFALFEAAPLSGDVLAASGRLQCSYPGPVIAVPVETAQNKALVHELAIFLCEIDRTILAESLEISWKAGSKNPEERETVNPKFVTGMLTGILRAVGRPYDEAVRIQKHIRDDVVWRDARMPWRRSALWLVLRVALQTTLRTSSNNFSIYKAFMIYFGCEVLNLAYENKVSNELLFHMNAKLSRRIYKAKGLLPSFILERSEHIIKKVAECLDKRWKSTQLKDERLKCCWNPSKLCFEEDLDANLNEKSREYLTTIIGQEWVLESSNEFKPNEHPRIDKNSPELPQLSSALKGKQGFDLYLVMHDFECWVDKMLEEWLSQKLRDRDYDVGCEQLSNLVAHYTATGKRVYKSSPESFSLMLLTTLELWVALDQIAVSGCQLLKKYPHDIPKGLLQSLLLPKKNQMRKLSKIEGYLSSRLEKATSYNPSLLSDNKPNNWSFSVTFYRESFQHQALRDKILENARLERERKILEFKSEKKIHEDLYNKQRPLDCTCWHYRRRYKQYCEKHHIIEKADTMTIKVHEWPLSENECERQATVFELCCPIVISVWRDTTFSILIDLCTPPEEVCTDKADINNMLHDYAPLKSEYNGRKLSTQRLIFASEAKSFLNTHYNTVRFPTSIESVCKKNGMNLRLWDQNTETWAYKQTEISKADVNKICSLQLPSGPYKNLQFAVSKTQHTSNYVIALQSECEKELSLQEFYAFGTLRAGHRLQWFNISRELNAQKLTFSDEAVAILLTQTAWQAGPSSEENDNFRRESHIELKSAEFSYKLLENIEDFWVAIRPNWHQICCAQILIYLNLRLLSLTAETRVKERAVEILRIGRGVTWGWARELLEKIRSCEDENKITYLRSRVLYIAALCLGTYDVEDEDEDRVLEQDQDFEIAAYCQIVVHDNGSINYEGASPLLRNILEKVRRLSFVLETQLQEPKAFKGLDQAVKRAWASYSRPEKNTWATLATPNDRWIITKSEKGEEVEYNLLTGQLLIDGSPLQRLPDNFLGHPTYRRLFGQRIFQVKPTLKGCCYESAYPVHGSIVELFFENDQLIIIQKKKDTEYELIPYHIFHGDFPRHLVENYTHWIDQGPSSSLDDRVVEFRPLDKWWETCTDNRRLSFSTNTERPSILLDRKRHRRYIGFQSKSAQAIYSILSPRLELKDFIEIFLEKDEIVVYLPRMKLEFFANWRQSHADRLECRQFRGMFVDPDQSMGTLVGLSNALVIRDESLIDFGHLFGKRKVLIPNGEIQYQSSHFHVQVKVRVLNKFVPISYQVYDIDNLLSRLQGNGNLYNRLYKIYLHAVTASCCPDPLTGRTGTEEALFELNSGATWSFQNLQTNCIDILQKIALLTPRRVYYPKHLEKMQTITWQDLPASSQHEEFYQTVQRILKENKRLNFFRQRQEKDTPKEKIDTVPHLVERAAIRNSLYRTGEFGGQSFSRAEDETYSSRDYYSSEDASELKQLESKVFKISKAIDAWSSITPARPTLIQMCKTWGVLENKRELPYHLGYDNGWLAPQKDLFKKSWIPLFSNIKRLKKKDRYQLMFCLGTMVFSGKDMDLIWTLLAFAIDTSFISISIPGENVYNSFELGHGFEPNRNDLQEIVSKAEREFSFDLYPHMSSNSYENCERVERQYESDRKQETDEMIASLMNQNGRLVPSISTPWSCGFVVLNTNNTSFREAVEGKFKHWYWNAKFQTAICRVQNALYRVFGSEDNNVAPPYSFCIASSHGVQFTGIPNTLVDVLQNEFPLKNLEASRELNISEKDPNTTLPRNLITSLDPNTILLRDLIAGLDHGDSFSKDYTSDLHESLTQYQEKGGDTPCDIELRRETLVKNCFYYSERVSIIFQAMKHQLEPSQSSGTKRSEFLLNSSGIWTRITPISLLRQLTKSSISTLSLQWKKALVEYGKAITLFQRAMRLLTLHCKGNTQELAKEAKNKGHESWDPMDYPDWLLLEIDNNLLIRPVQADLAHQMINPKTGKSSVFQLNMGEGKTSVILPAVSAALADGQRLVRVVVLKPLATQAFRLLAQRLGNLINRRVYFMPFSRSIELDIPKIQVIHELFKECMERGGILLVQPEHILSFKLMGLEKLWTGYHDLAQPLIKAQKWLTEVSRDILDESDEILHVKYQLIYTLGHSKYIEHSPGRWNIVQNLLSLLQPHAKEESRLSGRIEIYTGNSNHESISASCGVFPIIRILETNPHGSRDTENDVSKKLNSRLVNDIVEGRLPEISFRFFPNHIRNLAKDYVNNNTISEESVNILFEYLTNQSSAANTILLLRGLIGHKLLSNALKDKRWRVDYGLDESRTMYAVPYRAKDSPAPRAEFSHPEMAIILTCLSYYYQGLSFPQLITCFKLLEKESNPEVIYNGWIACTCSIGGGSCLPPSLQTRQGINLDDLEHLNDKVFPELRFRKRVIDFYLSHVVFPKEAKEFEHKLTTSGWDIAEKKRMPIMGFSGTNDNKYLLPLSVTQAENHLETNAEVLLNLLKSENNHYKVVKLSDPINGDKVKDLLDSIMKQSQASPIRVILDVGAQILWQNEETARYILGLTMPGTQNLPDAVVYFDEKDELVVITHNEPPQIFIGSPFTTQLDKCFVYLDEAHTRGTDLKFPQGTRAAVTLGPKLVKDRLVQACMRMRQLGKSHSVMFFAPEEVHDKICSLRPHFNNSVNDNVHVNDILRWSLFETIRSTIHSAPLWANQGLNFRRRQQNWALDAYLNDPGQYFDEIKTQIQEREALPLKELYGNRSDIDSLLNDGNPIYNDIRKRCEYFKITTLGGTRQQEEQEREIEQEAEQERQVERPPPAKARRHVLDRGVVEMINTGVIPGNLVPAFHTLLDTTASTNITPDSWPERLLVTHDFAKTIKNANRSMDSYMRPIHWFLTFPKFYSATTRDAPIVILSPYEVQHLLPEIRTSKHVKLHLYSARVRSDTPAFVTPPMIDIEPYCLNLFAGQLYFQTSDEYSAVSRMLGLFCGVPGEHDKIDPDGFVLNIQELRERLTMNDCRFDKSPVKGLRALMEWRAKGRDWSESHVGKLLAGRTVETEELDGGVSDLVNGVEELGI